MSADLAVPQLGEGLREVRIVEILRRAGDTVARGEPVYVVETDKSTVELEAPFDGTIERWTVAPGDVVAVGAVVALITLPEGVVPAAVAPRLAPTIPPRTRAHAREHGVAEAELARIPATSGKLMPTLTASCVRSVSSPTSVARKRGRPAAMRAAACAST